MSASLAELERTYATSPLAPLPTGVWRGTYLRELPMSLRDRLVARALFKALPFGLDLDRRCWWFGSPHRRVGHFETSIGRSRWRDAEVVRLDYRRTTPWPFSAMLYDELKPMADGFLGLGGVNRAGPSGAWFYFALAR